MKTLGAFNFWANSNHLLPKAGKLDRYLHSRMLQLEALEGRITPATYNVVTSADNGPGSFREAINFANGDLVTSPHTINFFIPIGLGTTITLATALPVITQPVTINGTTQSGYSANTLSVGEGNDAAIKIQLNGANLLGGGGVGLYLSGLGSTVATGSTVTGLSFVNFPFAIYANGDNITIKGNYFGVNANGTAQSKGLSGVGVDVATFSSAMVGGNTPADQNIFGNLSIGILQIAGSGSTFTGNRIGLGTTNTSFMPNTTGIQINNNANVDALNHSIVANLIGKNETGIKLLGLLGATGSNSGKVTGTLIILNQIGTDTPGSTNNLGNSGDAISLGDGVINTNIGISNKPNTIAYSNQNGVLITGATSKGNIIQGNNIRNNLGLGINLLNGANTNIASPVLTEQSPNVAGGFTYSGFVKGTPATPYTVDFYSSLISDSRSQGANYLGSTTVTTDASGNIGFTGFVPTQNQFAQGPDFVVTATATNVGFGTSKFSAGPPSQIFAQAGDLQRTPLGNPFVSPLIAKVVDSRGDPVPSIQVQFIAPNPNPATGTFLGNQQTFLAITNTVGQATSTTITANNAPGTFTVLASIVGNSSVPAANFSLTNTSTGLGITSFAPTSGSVGTLVSIVGSGFMGAVQVNFNGVAVPATDFTVNSATQITARVPAGASSGPISVITPVGTVTATTNFTVLSNTVFSFAVDLANPGQPVFVGVPVTLKLTALNSSGGVVSNFIGTVNLSTTDPLATIPAIVNFNAVDNGVIFVSAVLRTPGPVTVTATFQATGATGSGSGTVLQGSKSPFQVSSPSAPVPFPLGNSITKDLAILTGVTSATLFDYAATIVWGDGSPNSLGEFVPAPNQPGVFQVLGTHTYNSLQVFTGSVTVTRRSDNTNLSSIFNAVILTPRQTDQLSGASGALLPPGGQTADARISGISTQYRQPNTNQKPVILFAASFLGNPQAFAPTLPAQQFYDIRLINPAEEGALLTITANFSGGLQRGSSPYLQFAQDTSTSYQNVKSANNLVVINYINNTITVYLDQSSFPLINTLNGTVFAVVTNTTQVSSNTITILPAAFTSGTAVSIAWGNSSTLVDVANTANASNTTLTFQNSRQTTLSLAPSQSAGTVLLRTSNYGGTANDEASTEIIKQLTTSDILQNIIRGTIGIGPEVIGGMIKKMLPQNAGELFKQWSKVISETQAIPNDIITPEVKAAPGHSNNNAPTIQPDECTVSLVEDAIFEDISHLHSGLLSKDEYPPCLHAFSSDPLLEKLAFAGEINWAGLALSTLALSQFRTFSKDKRKSPRSIKISA